MKNYVAYFRVSTQKQGISGLGLEAQKVAVRTFAASERSIVAEFTEIESGKRNDREQLQAAIRFAKDNNATLLIAKLDRLSRNAGFILALRDSGVDFVCCDLPDANTLTIGIFAVMAQHERELISQRTKAALAAKKAQGYKLGKPENLTEKSTRASIDVRRLKARTNENNVRALALALSYKKQGFSLRKIADELNTNGFKTSRGNEWSFGTVRFLLQRAG